jgi:hypothetical protein
VFFRFGNHVWNKTEKNGTLMAHCVAQ